jgi:SAM-dependent methyltransferase
MNGANNPRNEMYSYDNSFFSTADGTAAISANGLIRRFVEELPVTSVLDVGCGRGVWLAQWSRHGATDVMGVDGPYIDVGMLHVPSSAFLARDVSQPFSLGRRFDLVQSLEVAEHLLEASADTFIDNLVRHGSLILFSAAIPGQGGEHHVNEQPWEYWRAKFAARGFELFDFLRPRIRHDGTIYFCYRFNSFIFAHLSAAQSLPAAVRASHVPAGMPIHDILPGWLKLRLAAVRHLPAPAVDLIARVKYRINTLMYRPGRPGRDGVESQ